MKTFIKNQVNALLEEYGLSEDGWTYNPTKDKRRLGICNYKTKVIGVSEPLAELFGEEEALQTVRHEVAHAIAGQGAGHGPTWEKVVKTLGGIPRASKAVDGIISIDPWVGTCSKGHEFSMAAAPRRVRACAYCDHFFKFENILRWSKNGSPMTPKEIGGKYFEEFRKIQKANTLV